MLPSLQEDSYRYDSGIMWQPDELVLQQNSFRYHVKGPLKDFIPGASRFAFLSEYYKFQ